jgi:hypothetical protein
MKVAIISNWHEKCGNADYARDLRLELIKEKEFEVITFTTPEEATGQDVVVISWHPSRVQLPPSAMHRLHERGMKVIVVLQNSFVGYYDSTDHDPLRFADAIIAHQKMNGNVPITYIPLGIHVIDDLPEPSSELRVGIAGFPYAWKRFDVTASVAQTLGGRSMLIAPRHDMGDVETPITEIYRTFPTADIERDLLPVPEVIRRLATCTMNVFWYQHMPPDDLVGQSGSVRMGVAAKRPMIISDHPKLSSIAAYEDEVYVTAELAQVHEYAKEIWSNIRQGLPVRRPKRLLEDMGWDKTGKLYVDLIKKVAG